MLDHRHYYSVGEALTAALDRWPDEICLIEADRDRENVRLTYRQFKEAALPLACALQGAGLQGGTRAAILMTNQSKWLISAYAIFFSGGVLVPIDCKLTATEQLKLLAHSKAEFLIVEYHLWRAITQAEGFRDLAARAVIVTEAPASAELAGAKRWEEFRATGESAAPAFVPRGRKDPACIVYSSGTGGRPKGCVLTHENYLEQCAAVIPVFPFLARSALPERDSHESCNRFHGRLPDAFHGRRHRSAFAHAAARIHSRCVYAIQNHLHGRGAADPEESAERPPRTFRSSASFQAPLVERRNRDQSQQSPVAVRGRKSAECCSRKFIRHSAVGLHALLVGGAFTEPATIAFFHDLGIPIYNGYGSTEACTAISINDLKPFRPDTLGKPVRGMEIRILNPSEGGIGEVAVRSKTVMSHYLDDPQMTAETIVDGWLMTGDLGSVDKSGHLSSSAARKT